MKTLFLTIESLLVCGGLWLWNSPVSDDEKTEASRVTSSREPSEPSPKSFVLGGRPEEKSDDTKPDISPTEKARHDMEAMNLSDPFEYWKALDDLETTWNARWGLREDLVVKLSEEEGVLAALNFVHAQLGRGNIRTEFVAIAFAYARDSDRVLITAMENLEIPAERARVGDALWTDHDLHPEAFFGHGDLSDEASRSFALTLTEKFYRSENPSEEISEIMTLWSSADQATQTDAAALKALTEGLSATDPVAAMQFFDQFGRSYLDEKVLELEDGKPKK